MDTIAIPQEAVRDNFRAMMRQYPATVTIITSHLNGVDHGMTATAVTSVSMDPPSLLVCLNNRTYLHEMLQHQPHFAVNVLAKGQVELSNAFSGKVSPQERFESGQWVRHESGLMTLHDAHARVVCKRAAAVPYGTHTLFIGQVIDAFVSDETCPLLYENSRYCSSHPTV